MARKVTVDELDARLAAVEAAIGATVAAEARKAEVVADLKKRVKKMKVKDR